MRLGEQQTGVHLAVDGRLLFRRPLLLLSSLSRNHRVFSDVFLQSVTKHQAAIDRLGGLSTLVPSSSSLSCTAPSAPHTTFPGVWNASKIAPLVIVAQSRKGFYG